jgi:hypothetical protein
MAEGTKVSKGAKIGIVVVILVVVAVVLAILFWPRSAAADDKPVPHPIPPPPPPPPPEPDPMTATTAYVKGQYHIVLTNDSDIKIVQKAAFSSDRVGKARRVMRDHPLNAWLPQKADDPTTSFNEEALDLFFGWEKMAGHEDLSWSWKTKRLGYGGYNGPIVYIPTDAEVQL